MSNFKEDFLEAKKVLEDFISDEQNFKALEEAGKIMVEAIQNGHKIISCGNGGSMCDAMHFAEELTGQFRDARQSLPAISISDASHISCVSNDLGFDAIFSRFVEGMGQEGDVLLAITTSGNSTNVLNAALVAQKKKMKVVALTGKSGGKLAKNCDVEIRATHKNYSDRIQEIHIKVIHSLINYIEMNI